MGVSLTKLIQSEPIKMEDLKNKKIAVDSFNWIYQFLSIIRQPDGEPLMDSKGNVTSHLSGLFYRTIKLLENGIKPIYVFDGKPPEFKIILQERKERRAEAKEKWEEAKKEGDMEKAKKYAMQSTVITEEIIEGSKKLLSCFGIPVIQAVSEGEALCSVMTKNGDAWSAATQDYDSLLFGCPRVVRNLSITGKKKRAGKIVMVEPELMTLTDVLKNLSINQEQLITLGILIGTDYNPKGIEGYGPKKSLELVKKYKTFDNIIKQVEWNFSVSPEEIYEFFRNPMVNEYSIEFKEIDEEGIKKLLCDKHEFSPDRIDSGLSKLLENKKKGQASLGKWIKK